MIRVIQCSTIREKLMFMRFPKGDSAFFRKIVNVPILKNGPHAFFLALLDDQPVMRVVAGVDYAYQRATGRKEGYIAFFDGEAREDAAKALFRAVEAFHKELGCTAAVGPIPLTIHGFSYGILVEGFDVSAPAHLRGNPAHYKKMLEAGGFTGGDAYHCYHIPLNSQKIRELVRAGEWTKARFSLSVRAVSNLGELSNLMARVIHSGAGREMKKALNVLRHLLSKEYLLVAFREDVPVGFMLGYGSGDGICVFTLYIEERSRMLGAYAALAGSMAATARERGMHYIRAAVISAENRLSNACAQNVGGYVEQIYGLYHKLYR